MILADTSAWVEYDRATGSAVDRRITALISEDAPLVTTEPVLMEVVAGARSAADAGRLRALLLRGGLLPFDAPTDFDAAARIYRRCREAGVTPRGMVDCMIAAVAWRRGAVLLCRDVDLERVAAVIGVELDPASTRR
ncbi:MAG TPA: PIN domain nuclease [Jatrophihabitans sp.]|nr:PIN domain nuclease [Jatrophihabitans sp.]